MSALALPDLMTLATVEVDYERSTPWTEVFRARSDRHDGVIYDVKYYPRESRWSCQCPAEHHPSCKHRVRAMVLREARWWERHLMGCTPGELRALVPGKERQVATETDALSAYAAILAINALLMPYDAAAA